MKLSQPQQCADYFALIFTATMIGIVLPAYLVAQSPADFAHLSTFWVRWTAVIVTAITAAALLLGYWILRLLRWPRVASACIWLVAIWVCTSGLGVPINGSAQLMDFSAAPISGSRLALAASITAVLTFAAQTRRRRFVGGYLIAMAALAFVMSAPAAASLFFGRGVSKAPAFAALSGKRNILVISFDGLSGHIAERLLRRDAELARVFGDFTIYRNAIANSPGTSASLRAELYGGLDFKSLAATEGELDRKLDANRLPLNDPVIDAFTYGSYNSFNRDVGRRVDLGGLALSVDPLLRASEVIDLYRYVAVRLSTRYAIRLLDALGNRGVSGTLLVRDILAGNCADCGPFAARLREHKGADWDRVNIATVSDLDGLTARLKIGSSAFSLRYMHFLFTHFPADFDRTCIYRAYDANWVNTHQNEPSLEAETACALNKLGFLLLRLKKIGAYDNAVIVVKSDHGAPAYYFDKPPSSYRLNGNPMWGYDRYRPLLMIKDIGVRRAALNHSERPAVLSDLANSLCRRIPNPGDCKRFPGADLLGNPANAPATYQIYVVKGPESTHSYDTHVARTFRRDTDLLKSLQASGDLSPLPAVQ